MSMLGDCLPYITKKRNLLKEKIKIKSNSKYNVYVNNEYTVNNGDVLYSVVIEIPIKIMVKYEEKSFLFFKWSSKYYSYRKIYFEVPFSLLCDDLYACYYPKNYIEDFNDEIIFHDIDITIDTLKGKNNANERIKDYIDILTFDKKNIED